MSKLSLILSVDDAKWDMALALQCRVIPLDWYRVCRLLSIMICHFLDWAVMSDTNLFLLPIIKKIMML